MRTFYRGSNPVIPTNGHKRLKQLLLLAPFVLCVYLLATGDSGILQIWHQSRQIGALQAEIAAIKVENDRLKKEAELLTLDLNEIERIARERYGMVKKNEAVYMVYPSSPTQTEAPVP